MKRPLISCRAAFACGIVLLSGCSTAAWYEGVKRGAENQCRQAIPADAEQCLARLNSLSHEQYDKERSRQQ